MKKSLEKLWKNPPAKYRGAPFWGWNGRLKQDTLERQIDVFEKMGFGGFHIHSRIGLEDEYLGKNFMKAVKFCHDYAVGKGMYTYLYDEDKWPSGCGGGRAARAEEFRARYLLFSPFYHENGYYDRKKTQANRLSINGTLTFLQAYRVELKDGKMVKYEVCGSGDIPEKGEEIWYAYRMITEKNPWFNNASYLDTLNSKAVEKFVEVGYEPYAEILRDEFSGTVPSIFTDEPQYTRMESLSSGMDKQEIGIPYTDSFNLLFEERYGSRMLSCLPEIFWPDQEGRVSSVPYDYMNLLADQFAESYAGVLGKWCEQNHLMLAGHLMEENGLENQLRSAGDVMRSYAKFQMPGIDILADVHEYTTAKQAQSVVNQMGKKGMISELYGVTNWDYDFRGHKLQGDWQAALGVTVRVQHLAWMYMGGESKRDYPAPIDAHSPWYKKYHLVEDYFSRVNLFMDYGVPDVSVGVIHPIESMFFELGRLQETAFVRKKLEEQFQELTKCLLFNLIDFDFISEALLPELTDVNSGKVGYMQYQIILVPELLTIRESTLKFLKKFQKMGGEVIVLGKLPERMDGKLSEEPYKLLKEFQRLGVEKNRIIERLESVRRIDICDREGMRSEDLICRIRKENEDMRLFIAHGKRRDSYSRSVETVRKSENNYWIKLKGCYSITRYDGMTDWKAEQRVVYNAGYTSLNLNIYDQDSVLLECFSENDLSRNDLSGNNFEKWSMQNWEKIVYKSYLPSNVPFRLEEPNVLLLDMAEFAVDGGGWEAREEILRLDDRIRERFGYRRRTDSFPQPWLTKEENAKEHKVCLKFQVESEVEMQNIKLAFEGDSDLRIKWNGEWIENRINQEYYVDEMIHTVSLSHLNEGTNFLECEIPFGSLTNLEWFYLLGNFGVEVRGDKTWIIPLPERIGFGDYAVQGMPFYGGNLIYDTWIETADTGRLLITADDYRGALLEIRVDDSEPKSIFMDPYIADCGNVTAGKHRIQITCYGTRINTFGQLHNCSRTESYFGPKTWRTQGKDWSYGYRLHTCGVLKAPEIKIISRKNDEKK